MKPKSVTITRYQELEDTEIEWTIMALAYPGAKATRMVPEEPPEVEYERVKATTPGQSIFSRLGTKVQPWLEFTVESFEGIMRISEKNFQLSDLDGEVLECAAQDAQDEADAHADYLYEQKRDDQLTGD